MPIQESNSVSLWCWFYPHGLEEETTKSNAWEDSNFREVRGLTNLLLRIKRFEHKVGAFGMEDENRDICFPGSTRK